MNPHSAKWICPKMTYSQPWSLLRLHVRYCNDLVLADQHCHVWKCHSTVPYGTPMSFTGDIRHRQRCTVSSPVTWEPRKILSILVTTIQSCVNCTVVIDVHECLIYKKNRSSGLQNHCMATTLWIETSSAYDGVFANYCY